MQLVANRGRARVRAAPAGDNLLKFPRLGVGDKMEKWSEILVWRMGLRCVVLGVSGWHHEALI